MNQRERENGKESVPFGIGNGREVVVVMRCGSEAMKRDLILERRRLLGF